MTDLKIRSTGSFWNPTLGCYVQLGGSKPRHPSSVYVGKAVRLQVRGVGAGLGTPGLPGFPGFPNTHAKLLMTPPKRKKKRGSATTLTHDQKLVWCVDSTTLGPFELTFLINMGSGAVLASLLHRNQRINSSDFQLFLEQSLRIPLTTRPMILITDSARAFVNDDVEAQCASNGLVLSRTEDYFNPIERVVGLIQRGIARTVLKTHMQSRRSRHLVRIWDQLKANPRVTDHTIQALKKGSVGARAGSHVFREALWQTPVFQEGKNAARAVYAAIVDLNDQPFDAGSQVSRRDCDIAIFIVPVILPSKGYPDTARIKSMSLDSVSRTQSAVQVVRNALSESPVVQTVPIDDFVNSVCQVRQNPDATVEVLTQGLTVINQNINRVNTNVGEVLRAVVDTAQVNEDRLSQHTQRLEAYIRKLEQQIHDQSVHQQQSTDKLNASHAHLNAIVTEVAANTQPRKKKTPGLTRTPLAPIHLGHMEQLMNATFAERNHYAVCRMRLCLVILFLTGMRVSELRQFRLKHLSTLFGRKFKGRKATRSITYDVSKTRKVHTQPLTDVGSRYAAKFQGEFRHLQELRKAWHHDWESSFLVSSEKLPYKPMSTEHLDRLVNLSLGQLDQPDHGLRYRSHSFRRGYIKDLWVRTNGDLKLTSVLIGHRSTATTARYIELDPADTIDAMARHGLITPRHAAHLTTELAQTQTPAPLSDPSSGEPDAEGVRWRRCSGPVRSWR